MQENVDLRPGAISCDDLPLEENVCICVLEWFTGLLLSETSASFGFSAYKAIHIF